jgi:hypothetical protein
MNHPPTALVGLLKMSGDPIRRWLTMNNPPTALVGLGEKSIGCVL